MTIDYDPNAPAFSPMPKEEPTVAEQSTEEEPATSEESVVEEKRVPYSRFEKVYESAQQAREDAERYRQEAEQLRSQQSHNVQETELPDYWVELFGDSDAAKKAYRAEEARISKIQESAEQRAIEALERRQTEETTRLERNVDTIDTRFEALSGHLGRDLTDAEESALLDIIDDFTPKDDDGNYAGALLPFDKAWEIYELQQQQSTAKTKQSRNAATSTSAAQSQGQPSAESTFRSGAWGSWRNRKELN